MGYYGVGSKSCTRSCRIGWNQMSIDEDLLSVQLTCLIYFEYRIHTLAQYLSIHLPVLLAPCEAKPD